MDYATLLNAAPGLLNAGAGLAAGKPGAGGAAGSALGGAAGGLFGPLGGAVGSAAGGLLGQGVEALMGGGKGRPSKKGKRRAAVAPERGGQGESKKAAAAKREPAKGEAPSKEDFKRAVQEVVRGGGLPPREAAAALAVSAQAVKRALAARKQISEEVANRLVPAGSDDRAGAYYLALARLGGLSPQQAILAARLRVPAGLLVRRAGLERVKRAFGLEVGASPKLLRGVGLAVPRPVKTRRDARQALRRLVGACGRAAPRWEVQLRGLEDDPRRLPPGELRPGGPGGTPGPVPVRPENWVFSDSEYILDWGDTLAGLAATYLGSAGRWGEIWAAQSSEVRRTRNPNKLQAGERLKMPKAAVENAKKLAAGAGPVQPNGQVSGGGAPVWAKVAGGAAGLAVLGGIGYALSRIG